MFQFQTLSDDLNVTTQEQYELSDSESTASTSSDFSAHSETSTPAPFHKTKKNFNARAGSTARGEQHPPGAPSVVTQERKSSIACSFWLQGKCRNGANCKFDHPPRKPFLQDVLQHRESISVTPDVEDGIVAVAPTHAGLPPLPPNGKCRVMGNFVVYFIPFYIPFEGKFFYKKIRLYRFNPSKACYTLVFSYRYDGFHITTASASNGYLVCSRLPYDADVLAMMAQHKKLEKRNQQLQGSQDQWRRQALELKQQNRKLEMRVRRAEEAQYSAESSAEHLRNKLIQQEQKTRERQQKEAQYQEQRRARQTRIFDNFRTLDPVDIFVFDPVEKTMVHVLEYHKPADHVNLSKDMLTLYDQKTNMSHVFKLTITTANVRSFIFDEPLRPSKLCQEF